MSEARRPLTPVLLALVALAWVALIVLGQSPYGRYLSHHSLDDVRGGGSLMLVFVAGWLLMLVAMMLPTSLPLIVMFERLVHRRPENMRLIGLLLVGYLSVWTSFGMLVYLGDTVLHMTVAHSAWLAEHVSALSAGVLLLAGLYQFTPLKYHCLDKCRSPFSFITEHWRGRGEQGQAFLLGIHHGRFCLGCCWTLMLVMFAVGVGNLGWMLVLARSRQSKKPAMGTPAECSVGLGATRLGCLLAARVQLERTVPRIELKGTTVSEVLNDAAAATSLRGLEGWYLQRYADQYGYKLVTDTTRVKVKVADWRATNVWRGFGAGVGPFGNLLKGSQSLANASPTL